MKYRMLILLFTFIWGNFTVFGEEKDTPSEATKDILLLQIKKPRPTPRSMINIPEVKAWQGKEELGFKIDRTVGKVEAAIYTEKGEKIESVVMNVSGGEVYSLSLENLPAGKYFFFLVIYDYQRLEFYGDFEV